MGSQVTQVGRDALSDVEGTTILGNGNFCFSSIVLNDEGAVVVDV